MTKSTAAKKRANIANARIIGIRVSHALIARPPARMKKCDFAADTPQTPRQWNLKYKTFLSVMNQMI